MTTILLVEDNEMNRDMLSRRLSRRGYAVLTAADGREAVEATRKEHPSLVLMDMSLPVMDGWTATHLLKSEPSTSAIPVVALTAHAMSDDRARALDAGCDAYETKPVELERLLATMESLLSRAGPPAAGPHPGAETAGAVPASPAREVVRVDPEIADLVPGFLENRRSEVPLLRRALAEGDLARVRALAHVIKGTGGGFGFPRITEIGAALESAARAGDAAAADRELTELACYLERVEPVFE